MIWRCGQNFFQTKVGRV